MIKIGCKIMLKEEVLDTKGRTLLELVQKEDFNVKKLRYGKYIEFDMNQKNREQALREAKVLAQNLLHNDLIETFQLEVLKESNENK
ncbi:MAG: phosphoribosylformylglycinamidine synthase subunit PurS [Bdellovibrionales bacterium]|nr:phosphoribosylformylglycinamidine synthase subunit PurS [Bdellovibrionales bacterium]